MPMDEGALRRAVLAKTIDVLYPPFIRSALLLRESFREKFGFRTDFQLSLSGVSTSISASQLYSGIRSALSESAQEVRIRDSAGREWSIEVIDLASGKVALSSSEMRLILEDMWMLCPKVSHRLQNFSRLAEKYNLPNEAKEYWKERIDSDRLYDDEVVELVEEMNETPLGRASLIKQEMEKERVNTESLVPIKMKYYKRLIGQFGGNTNIGEYAESVAKRHIEEKISWSKSDGLRLALLLSSHPLLTKNIKLAEVDQSEIVEIYEHLVENGDMYSQLGAIEIALPIIDRQSDLIKPVIAMVDRIVNDNTKDVSSRFNLLSGLVIFVDGTLSRSKVFAKLPPFVRRMASIAHASLIERCIVESGAVLKDISELNGLGRGQQFYLQSLSDLRLEPRWIPDFILGAQLKAEFIGRLINAGNENSQYIAGTELEPLILELREKSSRAVLHSPCPFFPGPLEGELPNERVIAPEVTSAVSAALSREVVSVSSFIPLINAALIFPLDKEMGDYAAEMLRNAKHQLRQDAGAREIFQLVSGLATVSAVTRSRDLADELKILIRRSVRAGIWSLSPEDVFRIGVVASASRCDTEGWCGYLGDWITELAFGELSRDDALRLGSHINVLCNIVPELCANAGRASAAIASIAE